MASNKQHIRQVVLVILTGTGVFSIGNARAQTFAEWFKQNSTQKKYLLQQIEALEVYSGYLKKGYSIAKGGLGSISGSLTSENNQHNAYYTGLKKVNPAIAKDNTVKEILQWQQDILTLLAKVDQPEGLSSDEKHYLQNVRTAVWNDCEQIITTLQKVVSGGQVEMSDADRIKLIQKLHGEMQDNYRFSIGFTAQAKTYAAQRQQEKGETQALKNTYGLN